MKNIYKFLTLIIACMLTVNLSATYYIVGNGHDHGTEWCSGKNWDNDGGLTATPLVNDEISCLNLPAGWYEFKITTGTWSDQYDYSVLDVANSSPMHKTYGNGGNICFRLQAAADVTIKMVDGKVVLLIDREYCITGIDGWGAVTGYTLTQANNYTYTFYNLSSGDYRFKVKEKVDNAWDGDCTWGYDHLDTENSNTGGDWDGDSHNIGFHLDSPSDVTIALVNNKICLNVTPVYFVAGNGNGGAWLNGVTGWNPSATVNRLDPETNSITYSSVPAGTYEFKVVKGAWGSNNEFDYDAIDSESCDPNVWSNDDNNIIITTDATSDITIHFDASTAKVSVTSTLGRFVRLPYSVVGDPKLGLPQKDGNWDVTSTATEMTRQDDGTYRYVIQNIELEAHNGRKFKIVGSHSWGIYQAPTSGDFTVDIPQNGHYNLIFDFDPSTDQATCTPVLRNDVMISAYGYSTFYSDKAWMLPDGLTATIFTQVNGTALVGESIDLIPANTGVLLSGTANATYTLLQTTTDVTYSNNLFRGTTSAETIADNGKVHYILGTKNGVCGLYWPSGTDEGVGAFDNKAGKAYLEIESSVAMGAPGFILRGKDVVTAVEDMPVNEDGEYYDLLGRKVANPQPGNLYICNGKKVLLF